MSAGVAALCLALISLIFRTGSSSSSNERKLYFSESPSYILNVHCLGLLYFDLQSNNS